MQDLQDITCWNSRSTLMNTIKLHHVLGTRYEVYYGTSMAIPQNLGLNNAHMHSPNNQEKYVCKTNWHTNTACVDVCLAG